jgi:carboxyl-terminal processing protease
MSRLSTIRKLSAGVILLVLFFPATGPAKQFEKEWKRCVGIIRSNYYAIKTRNSEIEKLISKYAPIAQQAPSRSQFKNALSLMFKEIGDSHFILQTNEEQGYYFIDGMLRGRVSTKVPFIGAFFDRSPEGWRVSSVFPGGSAEKAGLRKGDLMKGVNGAPFAPVQSLKRIKGKAEFEVARGDKTLRLEMEATNADLWQINLDGAKKTIRVIEQNGRKIGYIKLLTMMDPRVLQTMIDAMTITFKDTDAVIVDLREGSGGNAEGYPDVFFRPALAIEENPANAKNKRIYGYANPVVLLVGKHTVSAKEIFTYIMKASKRAKIVGQRTAGALLVSYPFRISSWAILSIPCRDYLIDGHRIEGVGIEPDIPVETEYGADGEDLVIKEALRVLGR